MFPRAFVFASAGIISCAGPFFGTLSMIDWINAPSNNTVADLSDQTDRVEGLKSALIYDEASLQRAADTLKLETSPNLKGVLDVLERLPDGKIRLAGWVADTRGDGTPSRIFAFAKGKSVLEGETNGERADVAAAFRLDVMASRNVKFELQTQCNPREALVVAAANNKNVYVPLKATVCP